MATSQRIERTFDALVNPTRRAVFRRVRKGDRSVREIVEGMDVSRPTRPSSAPAAAALQVVARRLAAQYPATERGMSLSLYPETEARPSPGAAVALHRASVLLLALVGLILLVAACRR